MDYRLIFPALFALASVILLGATITGLAVSESCCTGPSCAPDALCPESPVSSTSIVSVFLSMVMFLASIITYYLLNRKAHK